MKLIVYIVPILIISVTGRRIQKVEYHDHDGDVENSKLLSSSSLEEIPPREEWFKVKGDYPEQQQHLPFREQERYSAPSSRSRVKIIASAFDSRREGGSDSLPVSERSRGNLMHVNVQHRGRVGFQDNQGYLNGEQRAVHIHEPDTRVEDEDGGDEFEIITKAPPLSKLKNKNGQTQNWHLHIRHEAGHHNHDHDGGRNLKSSNIPQQPREPEPEDGDFVDEDMPRSRQEKLVSRQRDEGDTSIDLNEDYEYDGTSSSIKANKGRRIDALAIHNGGSLGRNEVVVLKNSRRGNDIASSVVQSRHEWEEDSSDRPPPHDQVARMARYIVHNSNWTSVATISTIERVIGYPFANIFSISDGFSGNSTGIPYLYLTPLDMSVIDLEKDSRASLTMSLAQSDYCRQQEYDPEDPRCAKVILSGRIIPVMDKDELQFAKIAMYTKHPDMQAWPKDHGFYFAKLDIANIIVLDYFGGAKTVTLDDYFKQNL